VTALGVVKDPSSLGEFALFRGLAPADLQRVNERLHRRVVPAGANLITADQPGDVVYLLVEGTVKILAEQPDTREVILAFLGAGDTVGEMSLVDSAGRSANVLTIDECTFYWMNRAAFQDCLQIPEFSNNLVRLLCARLRLANEQIQSLSSLDVAGRVARQLLAFAERYGQPQTDGTRITLRLTQSDLAQLVGASRERVNQIMVDLRQKGLIALEPGQQVVVRDAAGLARICH